MMENVKSVVLTLLVLLSLFQSYLLSYNSPKFEPINQNDYVQAELFGTQVEPDKLIFPDPIVLHTGKQGHTLLYPGTVDYRTVYDGVRQTMFENFRRLSGPASAVNWEDVRAKQPGVELRFRTALPFGVLQTALQLRGDGLFENERISKIWITIRESPEEVKVYLFAGGDNDVYETVKTNLTVQDVKRFVQIADNHPPYHTANGQYYLPDQPLETAGYRFAYTQYTSEELKKSLFVDPGITRNLIERDGSEIHTDGKRGLRIKYDHRWMNYSDPVIPVDNSRSGMTENLVSAVNFINRHGGWNGTYLISQISQRTGTNDEADQMFIFRQYYESFPIVNESYVYYGYMKALVQRGIVSNYERSIIVPDVRTAGKWPATLPGGAELDARIEAAEQKGAIASVYPAYRPKVEDDYVSLTPAWVVEYASGSVEWIQ
jgi:regulatory protein YycH of two-component signal transduction system YycFG